MSIHELKRDISKDIVRLVNKGADKQQIMELCGILIGVSNLCDTRDTRESVLRTSLRESIGYQIRSSTSEADAPFFN